MGDLRAPVGWMQVAATQAMRGREPDHARASCATDLPIRSRKVSPAGILGKPNDFLGTPYDINADWTDIYYGGGAL